MLASFSYAGFHTGDNTALQWLLGIGKPAVIIAFWSKYMAPHASSRFSDRTRLIVALVLFELSALALYRVHQPTIAVAMASISVINILFAYIWKQ